MIVTYSLSSLLQNNSKLISAFCKVRALYVYLVKVIRALTDKIPFIMWRNGSKFENHQSNVTPRLSLFLFLSLSLPLSPSLSSLYLLVKVI